MFETNGRSETEPATPKYHIAVTLGTPLCGDEDAKRFISTPLSELVFDCPEVCQRCRYVVENRCKEDGSTFDSHYDTGFEDGKAEAHAPKFADFNIAERETPVGVAARCTCGWGSETLCFSKYTAELAYVEHIRQLANAWIPGPWELRI